MDTIELVDKLSEYLDTDDIEGGIDYLKILLSEIPQTEFHQIIKCDFMSESGVLTQILDSIYKASREFFSQDKFFDYYGNELSWQPASNEPQTILCCLNCASVNSPWSIEFSAFSFFEDVNSESWLADGEFNYEPKIQLLQLEDIRFALKSYRAKELFKIKAYEQAHMVCDFLISFKLFELLKRTYTDAKDTELNWTKIHIVCGVQNSGWFYDTLNKKGST